MLPAQPKKWLILGVAAAASLGVQATAMANLSLSVVPLTGISFTVGQAPAQAEFSIQFQNLGPTADAVAAYDFGIAYDPTVMTLAAAGFSGFTDKLGDPLFIADAGVINNDHLDSERSVPPDSWENSVWDYTAASILFGPYVGPALAHGPIITGGGIINEGSLRFSQISLMSIADLLNLQGATVDSILPLFRLIFDVNTTIAATTPIFIVDDRLYATWDGSVTTGQLDTKREEAPPGGVAPSYYPTLVGSSVTVGPAVAPVPATWMLIGLGLVGIRRFSGAKA